MSKGNQDLGHFFGVSNQTTSLFFRTDRQKARHKSPPCISTGGLNKKQLLHDPDFIGHADGSVSLRK